MKVSNRQPKISDSLKISDFSNSLGALQAPPAIVYDCCLNIIVGRPYHTMVFAAPIVIALAIHKNKDSKINDTRKPSCR